MIISTFAFWIAAATCNAIMDTVADAPHFNDSIFSKLGDWWGSKDKTWIRKWDVLSADPKRSSRKKWFWGINYPVQLLDPWHFFKMWMIVFMACAFITAWNIKIEAFEINVLNYILGLVTLGVAWNFTFSVFYNKLLKKKK
jgi:hypothetical protein